MSDIVAVGDQVVSVGADHAPAMRQLFAAVFGHTMTPEHWAWKYQAGEGVATALLRNGQMVAHYGGVTRRVAYFGEAMAACQVCDVMVLPAANQALVRRGPLFQVTAAFLESAVGDGKRFRVAYGFPSARAHAVAQRLGLYGQVDEVVKVSWPSTEVDAARSWTWQGLGVAGQPLNQVDRQRVNRLWQAMAPAFSDAIVGIRDADWLQHRYLLHPSLQYEVLLVRSRWLRRLLGVLVLRRHPDHLQVMDVVAAARHLPSLMGLARHLAAKSGLGRVETWVTRSQLRRLISPQDRDAAVTSMDIALPANIHTPGPSVDALRDRWFLMAGDADFT